MSTVGPIQVDKPRPVVHGVPSNDVRSPDGVHFCPVATADEKGNIRRCGIYSSGAYRYANAMVEALDISS